MYISPMQVKRNKFYEEIEGHVLNFANGNGLSEADAMKFSASFVEFISELFGGQNFSFPRNDKGEKMERNMCIYKEFMGARNVQEMSLKYGITERGIYKIVKKVREQLKEQRSN
jgi:Mor family transcriptional regulator